MRLSKNSLILILCFLYAVGNLRAFLTADYKEEWGPLGSTGSSEWMGENGVFNKHLPSPPAASNLMSPNPMNFVDEPELRCALLFFGVPRLFRSTALPSIKQYILTPNSECDVFVHSFNISTLSVVRNNEENAPLSPWDLRLLVENSTEQLMIEDLKTFYARRNLTFFHLHHHKQWGESFGSTDNMVKAWHSIEGAWDLMEHYQLSHKLNYSRIGLFRLDVFYTHAINIRRPSETAVIPADFVWWQEKEEQCRTLVNDRGMYGDYGYAKIWATKRFPFAPEYTENHKNETIPEKGDNCAQGIHSESFLYELLNKFQVPYIEKEMCFFRLRANGVVLHEDCIIPGLDKTAKNSGYAAFVGFNREILSGLKCQSRRTKSLPIPCVEVQDSSYFYSLLGKIWKVLFG